MYKVSWGKWGNGYAFSSTVYEDLEKAKNDYSWMVGSWSGWVYLESLNPTEMN